MESAEKDAAIVEGPKSSAGTDTTTVRARLGLPRSCRVCGADHNESTCKFASYVCRVCNRQGHLRRMCPNIVKQYQVDVDEEEDSDEKRTLRSRFDLLRTERSVGTRVQDAQQRQIDLSGGVARSFQEGDSVWMRDYNSSNKWVKGSITNVDSARRYMIARDNGQLVKRHVDQIRRRSRLSFGGPNTEQEVTLEGESSVTPAGDNLIKAGKNEDERSDECVSEGSKLNPPINDEVGGIDCDQSSHQSPGTSAQPQAHPKRTRKPVIRFQCT
uniref:CCHC-type domain-containing protein n=1 Tax=Heliothis virescens TaxID=7102 RepID=A0A2A4K9P7_HELVI